MPSSVTYTEGQGCPRAAENVRRRADNDGTWGGNVRVNECPDFFRGETIPPSSALDWLFQASHELSRQQKVCQSPPTYDLT